MELFKIMNIFFKKIPLILFIFSIAVLLFVYGMAVMKYQILPYSYIDIAIKAAKELNNKAINEKHWYYPKTEFTKKLIVNKKGEKDSALILFSSMSEDNNISAKIINREGDIIHEWKIDWFKIWPDAKHIPEKDMPKSKPGTHIHGMVLMENGDLIFNFDGLGLVRLDICGNVIWKLPYRTHHSVFLDEEDNLWVPGVKPVGDTVFNPNLIPPYKIHNILKISLKGEIIEEIDLVDLLKKNNLEGLLYLSNLDDVGLIKVSGDIFHLNDVEIFPSYMEEGVFKKGDIMISLRNMSAVIVFSGEDHILRYLSIGNSVRQHDPDFLDGNTISVYDNYNIITEENKTQSRILLLSAINNQSEVYYKGSNEKPFFSFALGKHQWLPNGNILITESISGRIFEVDSLGNISWEYVNIVEDGFAGIVEEAQLLDDKFDNSFFKTKANECR